MKIYRVSVQEFDYTFPFYYFFSSELMAVQAARRQMDRMTLSYAVVGCWEVTDTALAAYRMTNVETLYYWRWKPLGTWPGIMNMPQKYCWIDEITVVEPMTTITSGNSYAVTLKEDWSLT